MKLKIRHYGDPILSQKAEPVEKITDEIRKFVNSMIETLDHYEHGVGLAATQVGRLLRIFIIYPVVKNEKGEYEKLPLRVFINPKILSQGKKLVEEEEGCLSLPGIHGMVIRPSTIKAEALDLDGNRFVEEVSDYYAREILHETDHLDGILFIDHLPLNKREELEVKLEEIRKGKFSFPVAFSIKILRGENNVFKTNLPQTQ